MSNHDGQFRRLAQQPTAPGVCPQHRLMNYPKITAQLDAAKIREEAIADTPQTLAQAGQCPGTDSWHIYIPTKNRMRVLRKRARRTRGQGDVPRETSDAADE